MSERSSVLIDMGNLSAPIGSRDWAIAVHHKAKFALNDNNASRELVERWVGALKTDNRFRTLTDSKGRPYLLWSVFCKDRQPWGLGYSEIAIDAILAERTEREVKGRATVEEHATTAEKTPLLATAEELAEPRKEWGKEGGRGKKNLSSNTTKVSQERGSEYLSRRIARNRPDIIQDMKDGKYTSVRQAALDAGIVKPEFSIPIDPQGAARRILKRFQGEQLAELIRILAKHAGIEIVEPVTK